jgi:hypothetical protein
MLMFGWFIGLASDQLKHFNFTHTHTHTSSTYIVPLWEEGKTRGDFIIFLDFFLFVKKMNLIDHDF